MNSSLDVEVLVVYFVAILLGSLNVFRWNNVIVRTKQQTILLFGSYIGLSLILLLVHYYNYYNYSCWNSDDSIVVTSVRSETVLSKEAVEGQRNEKVSSTYSSLYSNSNRKMIIIFIQHAIYSIGPIILVRPVTRCMVYICKTIILPHLSSSSAIITYYNDGGPLGPGYRKAMEVIAIVLLCFVCRNEVPNIILGIPPKQKQYRHQHHQHPITTSSMSSSSSSSSSTSSDSATSSWLEIVSIFTVILLFGGCINWILWLWSKYYMKQQQKQPQEQEQPTLTSVTTIMNTKNPSNSDNRSSYNTSSSGVNMTNHDRLAKLVSYDDDDDEYDDNNNNNNNNNNPTTYQGLYKRMKTFSIVFGWAIMNAFCEEYTSRGFWRIELEQLLQGRQQYRYQQQQQNYCTHGTIQSSTATGTIPDAIKSILQLYSNIGQSIIFGIMHYYGIPNGWIGVVLTLIYGLLMGYIADFTGPKDHFVIVNSLTNIIVDDTAATTTTTTSTAGTTTTTTSTSGDYSQNDNNSIFSPEIGNSSCTSSIKGTRTIYLFYPILAHAIADYYIFAYVVRKKDKNKNKNNMNMNKKSKVD